MYDIMKFPEVSYQRPTGEPMPGAQTRLPILAIPRTASKTDMKTVPRALWNLLLLTRFTFPHYRFMS